MPSLRILTWNSSGESQGQGQELMRIVTDLNRQAARQNPNIPVSLILIQEASRNPRIAFNPTIFNALGQLPNFGVEAHGEALPGQWLTSVRGYLLGWDQGQLTPAANPANPGQPNPAATLIDLFQDPGVHVYFANNIQGAVQRQFYFLDTDRHMRVPLYKCFTHAGRQVHALTWHAPLGRGFQFQGSRPRLNWRQGYRAGFEILQASGFFQRFANVNNGDLCIIGGDFNANAGELGQPGILPNWDVVGFNLSHIAVYTPNGNHRTTDQFDYTTTFPPHNAITTVVDW